MASSEQITCKIAFWYYRRMALMVGLLTAAGIWFYYDGKVGWPKKNVVALAKHAFEAGANNTDWATFAAENTDFQDAALEDEEAITLIKSAHTDGGKAMPWSEFVLSPSGKDALAKADEATIKKAFEAGADPEAQWIKYADANSLPVDKSAAEAHSNVGIDQFVALKGAFEAATRKREWAIFGPASGRKGWKGKDPHYHSKSEIGGQFAFAGGLWVISALTLIWAAINSRRVLRSESDAFITETGSRVPFTQVFRVDKRKWDNKGLAYAHFRTESGAEKRAIIDDLKYIGADQVLERILDNFEGELVERVSTDDSEAEEDSSADEPAQEGAEKAL
jgi:hypothetical protein